MILMSVSDPPVIFSTDKLRRDMWVSLTLAGVGLSSRDGLGLGVCAPLT